MQVTVHLHPRVAAELGKQRTKHPEARKLQEVLNSLGLELKPLHPGVAEGDLAGQFYVNAPTPEAAEEARRQLAASGAVEAAYLKPPESPPSQ